MKPKNNLTRIVKSPEGESTEVEISIDCTGKKPGRGAYICSDAACLKRIIKTNALSRAFKMQIPQDITEELSAALITEDS